MKRIALVPAVLAAAVFGVALPGGCSTTPPSEEEPECFAAPPPSSSADTWVTPAGRTLVWSDEFDGPRIDLSTWSYETEATGWSSTWNHEWQRYTDNGGGGPNACIKNGVLVICALKTTGGDGGFTSARMVTKNKRSWQYGTIAARIQLPHGRGLWPAFWLLGTGGAWPGTGEIDVMEMVGGTTPPLSDSRTHGGIHWADPQNLPASAGGTYENASPLSADWHYYELDWDATTITIKFDGIQVMTHDIQAGELSEFHQPFYLLLNIAVGGAGSWPGPPDATTVFPQYMYVDWVRVYQ